MAEITKNPLNGVSITTEMRITEFRTEGQIPEAMLMITLSNKSNTHQVILAQLGIDAERFGNKKYLVTTTIQEI